MVFLPGVDFYSLGVSMGFELKFIPVVMYFKIFVCIVSLCIFIPMLDYFVYENYLSYEC